MKKILSLVLIAFVFGACSPKIVNVPTNTDTHIEYRDSVIYKVDTLRIPVPVETIKEVVPPMDTLKMETSVAEAKAWIDTATITLKGEMKNKKTELSQPQVVYKEKTVYRDSLVEKEVPVPVEVEKKVPFVPFFWKFFSVIGILAIAYLTFKLIFKFKL